VTGQADSKPFRASGVKIDHPYYVVCDACGERVDDMGGEGLRTRAEAEEARRDHIQMHRDDLI
jgi:hypothetical protein